MVRGSVSGSARALARDGALVTIAGRTEQKLVDAAATLAEEGLDVAHVVCDALDSDVRAARGRRRAPTTSDGCTSPSSSPGSDAITPVLLFDDDDFSAQVDANVRPVYLFLKYAGQAMVRAGGGSFVAISSTAAVFSTKYLASYAAGKAAVDQLVRVAANELGELGIRVNSVQPGMTRTPGTERAFRQRRR